MVATASPATQRRDLLLAPRKLRVIQWRYTSPLFTTVHNPNTGELVLPDDGFVVGLHSKQRGGVLANAQTLNDIMSHGVAGPVRQLATERRITLGLDAQETHRINLENYWGTDWSDVQPDASGGVNLRVSELPQNLLGRTVLLGEDDWNGMPIYMAWILPRSNVTETGEQALQDSELAMYPYTINAQGEDALFGTPMIIEFFGEGWQAINERADSGFGITSLTSISVVPADAAIDLSLDETQQLTVNDSNGVNRTSQATYVSGTPSVATVSATGVVTPESVGTSVITASYGGFTDTCNVTVIA